MFRILFLLLFAVPLMGQEAQKIGNRADQDVSLCKNLGGGSENCITIDSNGNYGFGVVPANQFNFAKSNDGGSNLIVYDNTSNTAGSNMAQLIRVAGTSGGDPYQWYNISGGGSWSLGIDNDDDDKFKIGQASNPSTNTALTIDSAGNAGLGTSSPNGLGKTAHIHANSATDAGVHLTNSNTGSGASNGTLLYVNTPGDDFYINNQEAGGQLRFFMAGTQRAGLQADGSFFLWPVSQFAGNDLCADGGTGGLREVGICSSSMRYKHDIEEITEEESAKIYKLKPSKFKWNSTGKEDFGIIAEQANDHLPQLVSYGGENMDQVQGFNYRHFTALLLAEVKKLRAELDEVKMQVANQ